MTARDVAAYLLHRVAPHELTIGPGAWVFVGEVAKDIAMGSLEAALQDGDIDPKHYAMVDQWIGSGEETQPQPKDVED